MITKFNNYYYNGTSYLLSVDEVDTFHLFENGLLIWEVTQTQHFQGKKNSLVIYTEKFYPVNLPLTPLVLTLHITTANRW